LNAVWSEGLLLETDKANWKLLRHICYDHSDIVANYRLDDVPTALGAYLQLFILTSAIKAKELKKDFYESRTAEVREQLLDTLFRGYKREVRPELKEKYPQGGKPLNEAVTKAAEKKAEAQLDRIDERVRALRA
jgi:hypothetical protein